MLRWKIVFSVFAVIFGLVGSSSAQPVLPDGVTVHLFEVREKTLNPDRPMAYMDQEIWWKAEGKTLQQQSSIQVEGLPDYSYYHEVFFLFPHPGTGEMAFLARHKLVNKGSRTFFSMKKDGPLEALLPVRAIKPFDPTSKYASGHDPAMDDIIVHEGDAEIPVFRFGRMDRMVKEKDLLNFKKIVWLPGTRSLMMIGTYGTQILDLEKRVVYEKPLDNLLTERVPYSGWLNLSGGRRHGDHVYLYKKEGVFRINWDGSTTHLFVADKREPAHEIFERETISSGKVRGDLPFQVFANGGYFLIGKQVYDHTGKLLFQFSPQKSVVEICRTRPLAAVSHRKKKILKVLDLESNKARTIKLRRRGVLDMNFSEDGSLLAVSYKDPTRLDPHFVIYRLNEDDLEMVAEGHSSGMPVMVGDHLIYKSKMQLFVQKIGEEPRGFEPLPGVELYMSVVVDGEIMRSTSTPTQNPEKSNQPMFSVGFSL